MGRSTPRSVGRWERIHWLSCHLTFMRWETSTQLPQPRRLERLVSAGMFQSVHNHHSRPDRRMTTRAVRKITVAFGRRTESAAAAPGPVPPRRLPTPQASQRAFTEHSGRRASGHPATALPQSMVFLTKRRHRKNCIRGHDQDAVMRAGFLRLRFDPCLRHATDFVARRRH